MKKAATIFLATWALFFWCMATSLIAAPAGSHQAKEDILLKPNDVTKLKMAIAKWQSHKTRYLRDMEAIRGNLDYKNAAQPAKANLRETEKYLAELETILSKKRTDRNHLASLAKRLEGLHQNGKHLFRGTYTKYYPIAKVVVDPGDCYTTHAGYYTTAQCLYCQNQPKDSCMCMTSSGCKCYCDDQCNCGDLSVFEEGSRAAMLAGMCEATCHFNKKADELYNTLAEIIKGLKEVEGSVIRNIL